MNQQQLLLAALASGSHDDFSPVQLQKLMFLIDRNIGPAIGGPFFKFAPYDYGPFDVGVYHAFGALEMMGLAESFGSGKERRYRVNESGRAMAVDVLNRIHPEYSKYIAEVAHFVQRLSFTALVSSIYKSYPEMKVNSVFRG
ncbi:hypothetical protein [Dyella telluris]|uniref:Uncharacterized protein n=1 Tax=Dyella telluris TaxID=2763498 RepID=A0A7G8Q9M8_9GAMM|nr:hypothetical protein [Dyella telluris]QNK03486.1 hypothetical protein H8F01_10425 [Dyella telluris]